MKISKQEQIHLRNKIEQYQVQTKAEYKDILKEIGLTMTVLKKAIKDNEELEPEEIYAIKNATSYLDVITGESRYIAQKDLINLPKQEKDETIKQERRYIKFHQNEIVMGKEIRQMILDPETNLYFIKPGYCRATEHQIYRALRNKTYAAKLAKACKLGNLTGCVKQC